MQAAGEAESALFRLRTLLAHTVAGRHGSSGGGGGGHRAGARPASATAALACLDELQQLVQYLQAWGVPQAALLVDPLLAPHSDAFSGALFQCHLVQGSTGTTAVVAAGGRWVAGWAEWAMAARRSMQRGLHTALKERGWRDSTHSHTCLRSCPQCPAICRYDSLLKATWARQSALSGTVAPMPPLHAVGVTLNVDRLVAVAQASSRWRTPGNLPPGGALALACASVHASWMEPAGNEAIRAAAFGTFGTGVCPSPRLPTPACLLCSGGPATPVAGRRAGVQPRRGWAAQGAHGTGSLPVGCRALCRAAATGSPQPDRAVRVCSEQRHPVARHHSRLHI